MDVGEVMGVWRGNEECKGRVGNKAWTDGCMEGGGLDGRDGGEQDLRVGLKMDPMSGESANLERGLSHPQENNNTKVPWDVV